MARTLIAHLGLNMNCNPTSAALERLECVAADFLEDGIAEIEKREHVIIKDVDVSLTRGGFEESASVAVSITT